MGCIIRKVLNKTYSKLKIQISIAYLCALIQEPRMNYTGICQGKKSLKYMVGKVMSKSR